VLRYLAENAGRLVSRQELFEAVWPDVTVADGSITQCVRELREKLGDSNHTLIKTVFRRGYLLDAAVTAEAPQLLPDEPAEMSPEAPRTHLGQPKRAGTIPARRLGASAAVAALVLCAAWWLLHLSGWSATKLGALPRPEERQTADQFDGTWRAEFSHNELCAYKHTTTVLRITGQSVAEVAGAGKARGTVSASGELRLSWPALNDPTLKNVGSARLRDGRGEGDWVGQRGCAGGLTLTLVSGTEITSPAPSAVQLPRPGFKDCEDCPEMVALPAGEFMMGSPEGERGREDVEGLPRRVVIPKRFAIGKFEVTVNQFSAFVAETGITAGNHCNAIVTFDRASLIWGPPQTSFRQPGFNVSGSQPVVCISWHEARAYAAWLRRRTGKPYRLPTEAEWEYAARAGTRTSYSFGDDETALCAYAQFADLSSRFGWHDACRSSRVAYGPLPVGSLKPNPWGLFDMHGNAWEWVADCWTPNASEIPTNGLAFTHPGNCEIGVVRGGSFAAASRRARSAMRAPMLTAAHHYNNGFRVALSLDE
jgi:formylglycine-generating enzyme required for sulfatase activity